MPAVFLSYASEDAEPARRIAQGLETAGIEAWLDQSELRGGDAWDQTIRRRIRDCALFMPVVSAHTEARLEGYFRREWKLAVDRTQDMAEGKPFLLPVVIDATSELRAQVPEAFRAVQWTRLTGGEATPAFIARIGGLLGAGISSSAPPAASPTSTAPQGGGDGRARLRPQLLLSVLAIGAALAVVGYVGFQRLHAPAGAGPAVPGASLPGAAAGASAVPANVIPEKSVAVLPFSDLSEKHDQEYFSDGLAEELLDLLTQVPDLKVPARTSSFSFKGRASTVPEIAKVLGVQHVLEGSVRKSGSTIRVTVQLIRADTGYHLWSKTYDRDLKDIFKVQDEIATAVVEALKIQLLPTQTLVSARQTSSSEAHDLYLLGRQRYYRGTADSDREAIALYRRAIELDPNYAAAYAALAQTEHNLVTDVDSSPTRDQFKGWMVLLNRAIELDPQLSDGYAIRGVDLINFGDWAGARADLEKAVALDARDSRNLRYLARYRASQGEMTQALDIVSRAVEVDPLDSYALAWRADFEMGTGDYSGARGDIERALAISPKNVKVMFGRIALDMLEHQFDAALVHARALPNEADRAQINAVALCARGERQAGLAAIDASVAKTQANWGGADGAYVMCGDNAKALTLLETETSRQSKYIYDGMESIAYDPFFAPLRNEPRFRAMLRRVHLPN
jgi:TolB-like protein/tetratricopeptide (TPR) repeat protein